MKYFSLGPVEMFPSTLEVAAQQIPYFRTREFSELNLESERMLKQVLGAPENAKAIFLTASGTGAMEATVFNCFTAADKLLVIDGGIFGHRFVEICNKFNIPHDVIQLDFGEVLGENHLAPYERGGHTGLLVNIHETSTGQLYDTTMLSEFCRRNNSYLIVDAISSFLADPYDMARHGIDATILSSQKGLALGPGMSFVVLSDRLYEERVARIDPPSLYFDFKDYVKNMERGQTPYTPAVRVAFELHDMLELLLAEGMESRLDRVRSIAADFREKVATIPTLSLPAYPLSNAATPLLFDDMNGDEVYLTLKEERGICLTPCGGDLKGKMVRVGHIGNHTVEENNLLARELRLAVEAVQRS